MNLEKEMVMQERADILNVITMANAQIGDSKEEEKEQIAAVGQKRKKPTDKGDPSGL